MLEKSFKLFNMKLQKPITPREPDQNVSLDQSQIIGKVFFPAEPKGVTQTVDSFDL